MRTKAWFTKDNRNHKYLFPVQLTTAETRFCSRLFLHMMKGAIFLKPKQQLFITLLVIIGTLFNHLPVTASAFNFSVTPITSENQIDKRKTYFDLQLVPDQEVELKAELRNDTEKEVKIDISVNSATTNSNVMVEYGKNEIEKDESLIFDLIDYVSYPETVTLEPKSVQTVVFHAKMPKDRFDGVLAGGITFKEIVTEKNQTENKDQSLSIENEYAYTVALLMRQTLNEVAPNLVLHEVKPDQINARNVILANVQNDQKTYINQVVIETKITKKGHSEVLYQEVKEGLQIAPNTNFSFPTALNGQPLTPGEYHLTMTILGNENENGKFSRKKENTTINYTDQWIFEKVFMIDGKEAKELNTKDVTIKKTNNWIYILEALIFLLFVLILILWFILRKKEEKEK